MAVKTEDGQQYPASAYLYVPDPDEPSTWKLRFKEYVGGRLQVTRAQLGRAAAALSPGGFRGNRVELPADERRAVIRKLLQLYRENGWEPPEHLDEASRDEDLGATLVRLTEAASTDDGAGKVWRVTLIRPGWSENGVYYSRETLARAASLYEGAKAYADHPTRDELRSRPERSVRDLVGWYEGVRQEPDGRLTADLHLLESAAWLAAILKEKPDLVGLSHHAIGRTRIATAEGRTGRVVESIARVVSVDVVTEPAAGGSVDRLVASNREGGEDSVTLEELTLEVLRKERPDLVEAILAEAKQGAEEALGELRESVQKTAQENAQLRESLARMEARAIIAERAMASNLPEPAKARVRQLLEAQALPMKDGVLDAEAMAQRVQEAIKAEADYLAKVGGSPVRGAGDSSGAGGDRLAEALQRTEAVLDRLFGLKTADKPAGGGS